jgi:hypothetical protein
VPENLSGELTVKLKFDVPGLEFKTPETKFTVGK